MLTLFALLLLAAPAKAPPCPREMPARYWLQPIYPKRAVKKGLGGKVRLEALVAADGRVKKVEGVEGDEVLIEAAKESLQQWRFQPCAVEGKAREVALPVEFEFHPNEWFVSSSVKEAALLPDKPHRVWLSSAAGARLIRYQVKPEYPVTASYVRKQGLVVMRVIIRRDGGWHSIFVDSGPQELVQAAKEAVQQWRFKPYLVDGEPVEVETEITIRFRVND